MLPTQYIASNLQGLIFIGPEIVLTGAALLVLLLGVVLSPRLHRRLFTLTGAAGLAAAMAAIYWPEAPQAGQSYLSGLFVWDPTTAFFKPFVILVSAICLLLAHFSNEIDDGAYNEYTLLIISVTIVILLLVSTVDLLMVFLAFEAMGILCYLLVGMRTLDLRGGEAALKYLLYGSFTSGILLFGFSMVFGVAGSTDLHQIAGMLHTAGADPANRLFLALAMVFFMAGLLFKIASFPFHFWCPDVYEGAPTPITAFLSVGPKAAGFVLFIRLFYPLFAQKASPDAWQALAGLQWPMLIALLSAAGMTLGNLAAMRQTNLKRLLAYSSIAHAGYLLMGIATLSPTGLRSVAFYLVVYLFMNLGAFGVVSLVVSAGGGEDIDAYRGMGATAPLVCVAMATFLFSLVGIPPFAGFAGKVYLFAAVIDKGIYWLAVVAAINTVVSLYYYLRVVKAMFLDRTEAPWQPSFSWGEKALMVSLAVPTLVLGVFWQPLAQLVKTMY